MSQGRRVMGNIERQEGGCDCPTCGAHFSVSRAFCAIGHARVACVSRVVKYVPADRLATAVEALDTIHEEAVQAEHYGRPVDTGWLLEVAKRGRHVPATYPSGDEEP
jgi:hypothetical protein